MLKLHLVRVNPYTGQSPLQFASSPIAIDNRILDLGHAKFYNLNGTPIIFSNPWNSKKITLNLIFIFSIPGRALKCAQLMSLMLFTFLDTQCFILTKKIDTITQK